MAKYNPAQTTMFDEFANGVFRASPPAAVSGRTEETRSTSRAAAKAVAPKLSGTRLEVLRFIVGKLATGATDEEIQLGLGMGPNTQRPRRVELQKVGLIRPAGARPTSTGSKAVVWIATPEGMKATDGNG